MTGPIVIGTPTEEGLYLFSGRTDGRADFDALEHGRIYLVRVGQDSKGNLLYLSSSIDLGNVPVGAWQKLDVDALVEAGRLDTIAVLAPTMLVAFFRNNRWYGSIQERKWWLNKVFLEGRDYGHAKRLPFAERLFDYAVAIGLLVLDANGEYLYTRHPDVSP